MRRKISGPGGEVKDAELMEIQQSKEQWCEHLLGDGSVVKLKAVVTEIWRIVGEYDNEGNPIYVVKSRNVVAVTSPDELRKPAQ